MPYKKSTKKSNKKWTTKPLRGTSFSHPATSIVSPTRQAAPFGAEGASASMADRAVRAARL
jgi:hypothetical protein